MFHALLPSYSYWEFFWISESEFAASQWAFLPSVHGYIIHRIIFRVFATRHVNISLFPLVFKCPMYLSAQIGGVQKYFCSDDHIMALQNINKYSSSCLHNRDCVCRCWIQRISESSYFFCPITTLITVLQLRCQSVSTWGPKKPRCQLLNSASVKPNAICRYLFRF